MDFRPKNRELSDAEKAGIDTINTQAQALGETLSVCPANREIALAKTKLEECVMWAVKGVTG